MTHNRMFSFAVSALLSSYAACGAEFVTYGLSVSAFADTESSTNIPLGSVRMDVLNFSFDLSFVGTPSNNVQAAFGRDSDSDGTLSPEETDLVIGWRSGFYFVENTKADERVYEAPASLPSGNVYSLSLDVGTTREGLPRRVSLSSGGFSLFPAVQDIGTGFFYDPSWNMMRITRRGVDDPEEWCRVTCEYRRFIIFVR